MLRLLMSDLIFHPLLLGCTLITMWMVRRLTNMLSKSVHPAGA